MAVTQEQARGQVRRGAGRPRAARLRVLAALGVLLAAMIAGLLGSVMGQPVPGAPALAADACGPGLHPMQIDGETLCAIGPEDLIPGFREQGTVPAVAAGGPRPRLACIGDGSSGMRVQPLYVYEQSKGSRYGQYGATIDAAISGMDSIFTTSAQQTGGVRRVRFVTDVNCAPVVGIVMVPDGSLSTFAGSITAVRNAGYNRTDRNYAMFVDVNLYCGIGTIRADSKPTQDNLNNLGGAYARVDSGCWSGFAMAHEVMHGLGAVQLDAPHSTGAWHCTDERDVMCYSDQGTNNPPMQQACTTGAWALGDFFDCNHDDYFTTSPSPSGYLATHWNTANSVFLDASGGQWPGAIAISPSSGPVGTAATVTLTKFKPGTPIVLKFDGAVVASKVADANGAATITFTVPKTTGGYHQIYADTPEVDAETVFNVTTSARIKPKRARAGQTVELDLAGFGKQETVTVKIDGKQVLRAAVRKDGSLETTVTMPASLSPKQHTVVATGADGSRADTQVDIKSDRADRQRRDRKQERQDGPRRGADQAGERGGNPSSDRSAAHPAANRASILPFAGSGMNAALTAFAAIRSMPSAS